MGKGKRSLVKAMANKSARSSRPSTEFRKVINRIDVEDKSGTNVSKLSTCIACVSSKDLGCRVSGKSSGVSYG
jgi:hypothetical protein